MGDPIVVNYPNDMRISCHSLFGKVNFGVDEFCQRGNQ